MKATPIIAPAEISYEQFCSQWIADVKALFAPDEAPTGRELRREIIAQITRDGLDNDFGDDEIVWIERGAAGLDAYFWDNDEEDDAPIMRVVRFLLSGDLPADGRAVTREVNALCKLLNQADADGELEPLLDFWRRPEPGARLIVTFVSPNQLPASERDALPDAAAILAANAPLETGVEAISLHTIYTRDYVDISVAVPLRVRGELDGGFIIGAVSLPDLYEFLREFRGVRGELDSLYDKNVRVFLGRAGKTNKGISKTLREEPENFGLFNNGLTIVARAIEAGENGAFVLTDPAVVNGCQTTRTLWETLTELGREPVAAHAEQIEKHRDWRARLERGSIAVKIVRVAPAEAENLDEDDGLLGKITRYTNTQNTVQEKDFIALDRDFRRWKRELATRGVFLEILRNEGKRQKDRQKKRGYQGVQYEQIAKAFELLKVYGAGWMNEPGAAWNKNAAFVPPRGKIFREIMRDDNAMSGDDFLAALYLQSAGYERFFGRRGNATPDGRRLTRHLFYRTAVELTRRILKHFGLPAERGDCSRALLAIHNSRDDWRIFMDYATEAIDDYMKIDGDYSIQKEPVYGGDFNAFFKREDLAKSQSSYPQLWSLWNLTERLMLRNNEAFAGRLEKLLRE